MALTERRYRRNRFVRFHRQTVQTAGLCRDCLSLRNDKSGGPAFPGRKQKPDGGTPSGGMIRICLRHGVELQRHAALLARGVVLVQDPPVSYTHLTLPTILRV